MTKIISAAFTFILLNTYGQSDLLKTIGELTIKEDYNKAYKLSDKYIEKDTLNSMVYFYRALCQRKNGDYQDAFIQINRSIYLNKNNSNAYTELGNIFAMTNEFDKALENYNKAIELNTTNSYAYNSKGALYNDHFHNDTAALTNFSKAVLLDKKNIRALFNVGLCLNYQEKYDQAIIHFTGVIKLKKDHHKAYYERGISYYSIGNYKAAIKDFNSALKYNNFNDPYDKLDNLEIYDWLSDCHNSNGEHKKAKLYLSKAKDKNEY